MKVAIMQPYIFPYIGYFQLINAVDTFVIYDNIQFTKKGWINRNRILINGKDEYITLTLKKDSDYLNVNQRYLSTNFDKDKIKLINKIRGSYQKAPHFKDVFPLIEDVLNYDNDNLFDFIYHSILILRNYLEIHNTIIKSSDLEIDVELYKGEDKVLAICNHLKAETYINPIGGAKLYDRNTFKEDNIDLVFLKSKPIEYKQFKNEFVPWLSIIDVLMFNTKEDVQDMLNRYELN